MRKFYFAIIPLAFLLFSCASSGKSAVESIPRGSGAVLGEVSAVASVSENRKTGKTSGDTQRYGQLTNQRGNSSQVKRLSADSLTSAAEIAYANALYEIIQKARAMGGDALNEVASSNRRSYDPQTDDETVTVTITAQVIKTR